VALTDFVTPLLPDSSVETPVHASIRQWCF
jgi:hypothetical protein